MSFFFFLSQPISNSDKVRIVHPGPDQKVAVLSLDVTDLNVTIMSPFTCSNPDIIIGTPDITTPDISPDAVVETSVDTSIKLESDVKENDIINEKIVFEEQSTLSLFDKTILPSSPESQLTTDALPISVLVPLVGASERITAEIPLLVPGPLPVCDDSLLTDFKWPAAAKINMTSTDIRENVEAVEAVEAVERGQTEFPLITKKRITMHDSEVQGSTEENGASIEENGSEVDNDGIFVYYLRLSFFISMRCFTAEACFSLYLGS